MDNLEGEIMIKFDWYSMFRSMKYFLKLYFVPQKYDVVFIYPDNYNRGKDKTNSFLKPLIESCKNNNISYIVYESTELRRKIAHINRDPKSIPLDFMLLVRVLIRRITVLFYKIKKKYDAHIVEVIVTDYINKIFFKNLNYDTCIQLSTRFRILMKTINPNAKLYEYQHGIIYEGHKLYLQRHRAVDSIVSNNINLLVHGDGFKNLLINRDTSKYYNYSTVITIGQSFFEHTDFNHKHNNKSILFSLQIVPDFSNDELQQIIEQIYELIEVNTSFLVEHNYKIIFKHHPRYHIASFPSLQFNNPLIEFAGSATTLEDLFSQVSLHCTFSSTTTFDAALHSIPTIFIENNTLISNLFFEQYNYPQTELKIYKPQDLETVLLNMEKEEYYMECSKNIFLWAEDFYQDFNENNFLQLVG